MSDKKAGTLTDYSALHISEMVLANGNHINTTGSTSNNKNVINFGVDPIISDSSKTKSASRRVTRKRHTNRNTAESSSNKNRQNNWSPLTSYLEKAAHMMNEIGSANGGPTSTSCQHNVTPSAGGPTPQTAIK